MGEERTAGGSSKRQRTREAGETEGINSNIKQGTGGRTFETPVSPPPRKEDLNGFFTV